MNDETIDPKYENTLGERMALIIIVSTFTFFISVLSFGLFLIPTLKLSYEKIFYHLQHNKKEPHYIKTYFKALKSIPKTHLYYSLILTISLIGLITLFRITDDVVGYVIVYFLLFEIGVLLINGPPILAKMALNDLFSMVKTTFLLGHLHTSSTLFNMGLIIGSVLLLSMLELWIVLLIVFPLFILYMTLSSIIFFKSFRPYS